MYIRITCNIVYISIKPTKSPSFCLIVTMYIRITWNIMYISIKSTKSPSFYVMVTMYIRITWNIVYISINPTKSPTFCLIVTMYIRITWNIVYISIISTKSPSFCLLHKSRKLYCPRSSVTWLRLLSRRTTTRSSVALTTETHWPHSFCSLTRGMYLLSKRVLHRQRSSASSFNFQYHLFPFTSSCSCYRLLSRLSFSYILPSIFLLITWFVRQLLRKMWPIQLAVLLLYVDYSSPPWL